ncbi:MAG: hypothetical protein KJ685_02745, partial [Nanoarchaeota archaeon]|nr:hypothetical protein [Nanoarchaeota archaeon]
LGEEDTSGEQKSGAEKVSGERNLVTVVNSSDFLTLKGIECYDHKGKVMEQYDELLVAKDVERKAGGKNHISFTPYDSIVHFERQGNGLFLPSFALLCNVVLALYDLKDKDSDVREVLDQFNDYGSGYGRHNTNTLVDWKDNKIIHYPDDSDFPECGGKDNINSSRKRNECVFDKDGLDDLVLEAALKVSNYANYLKDLTGLKNPRRLVDVAKYFGETAMVWVPDNVGKADYVGGAWLGCGSNGFDLLTCDYLGSSYGAVRGVGAGGAKERVK